jgi:hypothetical protein
MPGMDAFRKSSNHQDSSWEVASMPVRKAGPQGLTGTGDPSSTRWVAGANRCAVLIRAGAIRGGIPPAVAGQF